MEDGAGNGVAEAVAEAVGEAVVDEMGRSQVPKEPEVVGGSGHSAWLGPCCAFGLAREGSLESSDYA